MQKTVEHAGVDNGVSPAVVDMELLIHERSKGKSLRQLGQMFGKSHERIRQLLAQHDRSPVRLLSESRAAAKLRYPMHWLVELRKKGMTNPIKPGGDWLYSEEQVRQILSLITESRICQRCGKPRPLGSRRFCIECKQYRDKERSLMWRKANPERWKEIFSRANRKRRQAAGPPLPIFGIENRR